MKRISRIFLFGAFTVILLTVACAPAGEGGPNLVGALQDDLTGSPTASGTAEPTTATAETSQATATNTTLTPSTRGPGPEVIFLDCQYCVDTVAHAQLLLPRNATFEVISPPELVNNGDDDDKDGDDNGEARRLSAQLSGAAEVPGPGDPDGSGKATITLRPEQGEACFELSVSNIEPATAAHIHEGAEGVAGPVVIPLDPAPTEGSSSGCVSGVDTALLQNILQNPKQYYVNVHNEEFPDGAVRGQLGRVDDDDEEDDDDNGDRLGCRTIDRFKDTKLVLCRAEENTTIILNVCQDDACREVQLTLQSCTLTTGTPSPIATITTTTPTAIPTLTPIAPTATLTFTPVAPATETPTPTVGTNTPTAPAPSTNTPTATSTATGTPTP